MTPRRSLDQVLGSLSRTQVLQCLVYVQARRDLCDVLQRLLETRLASLMSMSASSRGQGGHDHDELLTADEAAKTLKVPRARIYELVRRGDLAAVKLGKNQRQIRIPVRALSALTHVNSHPRFS